MKPKILIADDDPVSQSILSDLVKNQGYEVVITNTIPLTDSAKSTPKIRQLSTAFLFAETIRRITDGESVTSLFSEQNNNF